MSRDRVRVRYDGPALAGHSIDVDDLAPALLALGELCKLANRKFNGDRASIKVLINVDVEQNCFELNVELVQTIFEAAKSLLTHSDVATAKEIFEWLGLVGSGWGLFRLLKYLNGRQVTEKTIQKVDGKDVIQIKVDGDNNVINVDPKAMELLEDSRNVKSAQKVVKPLTKEGYDSIEFEDQSGKIEKIDRRVAESILKYDADLPPVNLPLDEPPDVVTAWIQVYSPVYEHSADTWRFFYGEGHAYMDISETDIAERALERGGALVNDNYKVRLEITQSVTDAGRFKNHYKILEVLDFKPAQIQAQQTLYDDDDSE